MLLSSLKKYLQWEHWPFEVFYFPIIFYWIFLSLKSRSLCFFSTSNPGIEYSGFLGESKIKILDKIPDQYKPKTLFLKKDQNSQETLNTILKHFSYPFILKPDVGERGRQVEMIKNEEDFENYWTTNQVEVICQEFIDLPNEAGVFYHRLPGEKEGKVTSIVLKEFLFIIGDGIHSIEELMNQKDRARRQIERLKKRNEIDLNSILAKNQTFILEPIGNHNRGTAFLNGNFALGETINKSFTKISNQIDGFYFGRFDLKFKTLESLKKGEDLKILELNGAGSEPGHIYDPGTSIFEAYHAVIQHLKILQKIAVLNHKKGFPYMTVKEALKVNKKIKAHQKKLNIR